MSSTARVSFTVRRPTPVSRNSSSGVDSSDDAPNFKIPALPRHIKRANGANGSSAPGSPLSRSAYSSAAPSPKRAHDERDSEDEEEGTEDEIVTGFDQFGVQRLKEKKGPTGPMVIAPLANRDWREAAKRRRMYVPDSARAAVNTGADGSVGGLGTRDAINSGPQLSGLQFVVKEEVKVEDEDGEDVKMEETEMVVEKEETEDERAARFLLARASGTSTSDNPAFTIPTAPLSETDAYKQDVDALPESASLADYERVPIEHFGAALLRGMGWKEGTGASRSGKGPTAPFLPTSRPALLGIGAKEKEVLDDGSVDLKKKMLRKAQPERRYVPVVRREGEREGAGPSPGPGHGKEVERRNGSGDRERNGSASTNGRDASRRRSPEPSRSRRDAEYDSRDRRRDDDRRRDYDRRRSGDRDRDRDHTNSSTRDYAGGDRDRRGGSSWEGSGRDDRKRDRRD